jgi:cytoskeletal protein CcmA (bactofilin family)
MKAADARTTRIRLSMLVAALTLATTVQAAEHPDIPEPPEPPSPPEVSVKGLTIRPGETHKGNIVRFAPSVAIEGTLDGDLWTTASTVRISGVVTGDVFAGGSSVDLTGKVEKSFRAAAGSIVVDGTVEGNVLVVGGNLVLGSKAHVVGSVTAYTGEFTHHGVVDGSLTFTGGTARIGGKVLDDATLTADAIQIEPGARVEGDITYSTRKPMDDELTAITGGDVTYDEAHVLEKKEKKKQEHKLRPTKFGVGVWIAFFTASFLFGCALLAVFKEHEPKVTLAIRTDALRCTGIGFVSILVTIAVCLSLILLITIPFIVIYLIAYLVAFYLAKVPVAIWLGRFVLEKVNRPSGPYMALFVGLIVLYLVFMIPFCFLGAVVQFFTALLGLGAMTMTYLAHRQARKEAAVGGTPVSS